MLELLIALAPLTVALEPPRASVARVDEPVRLAEWPELDSAARRGLKTEIAKLRKARTEEMEADARVALAAIGPGAAPDLLAALGKAKADDEAERIETVLTELVGAAHTRLLAREFADKAERVRVYCLRTAALHPDAGIAAESVAALAAARQAGAKAERPPAEDEELFAAALAATSSGSLDALDVLLARARSSWKRDGLALRTALVAVRGKEATLALLPKLREGDDDAKEAVLNVLSACGDRDEAVPYLRPFLDSETNSLRIATINALRAIVDGAEPLENISVFDAIERARKWKGRL